jgi:hypothetical protein
MIDARYGSNCKKKLIEQTLQSLRQGAIIPKKSDTRCLHGGYDWHNIE